MFGLAWFLGGMGMGMEMGIRGDRKDTERSRRGGNGREEEGKRM